MTLLTIAQAAERLAVHPNTVRSLVDRYEIDAVDLRQGQGGKRLIRIPETSLDRYIRSCAMGPVREPVRKAFRLERRRA